MKTTDPQPDRPHSSASVPEKQASAPFPALVAELEAAHGYLEKLRETFAAKNWPIIADDIRQHSKAIRNAIDTIRAAQPRAGNEGGLSDRATR